MYHRTIIYPVSDVQQGRNGLSQSPSSSVIPQAGSGVRCVYASVGQSQQRQQAALHALQDSGAMSYSTAVVAPEGGLRWMPSRPGCSRGEPLCQRLHTGHRMRACLRGAHRRSGRLSTHVLHFPGAPLGRQYGTLCSALAIAEQQRDAGRHTLVVLDDISCMVGRWHFRTARVQLLAACNHRLDLQAICVWSRAAA